MQKNNINCGLGAPGANATQSFTEIGKKYSSNVSSPIADAIEKEMNRGKILPVQASMYEQYWNEAKQYDFSNICPEIDITKDYGEDEFLLEIGGVPTMPRGDIQAIKAHAKEGKTMLISIIITALLGSEKDTELDIRGREENLSILYFDTEQHPRNTKRIMLRINAMRGVAANTPIEGISFFAIRELSIQHRINFILDKIKTHHPDVVIIDGIRDLVQSINDEAECNNIIQLLTSIAMYENIAILCVLHKNKNKLDDTMRGHLGAELENKSSSIWEVSRNGNIVTVDETHARNEPTEKWQFKIGEGGIPCPPNAEDIIIAKKGTKESMIKTKNAPKDYSDILHLALIKEHLSNANSSKESVNKIIQNAFGVSDKKSRDFTDYYIKKGWLVKTNESKQPKYKINAALM